MPKYRKKQVEVEAVQWTGENQEEVAALVPASYPVFTKEGGIRTWIGVASVGDYIYREGEGSCRFLAASFFEATYEPADQAAEPREPLAELPRKFQDREERAANNGMLTVAQTWQEARRLVLNALDPADQSSEGGEQ